MPVIEIKTLINSDIETCFDIARDIDAHQASLNHSNERAIKGKTSGLIELGEWVTWQATHFGIKQRLTSKITELDRPNFFVDEMVSGAFKSFRHEHQFDAIDTENSEIKNHKTLMIDTFHFQSPFGVLGKIANHLFLKRYMTRLLLKRNQFLKQLAENLSKTT
ncbi:MAG: SRPBCC family protein [Algicola sp.]|nr:SRPBCC family protein [Algicola sp.]